MINFIICDDSNEILINVKNIIHNYMIKNNYEYRIHSFNDYNDKFMNIITTPMSFKIYILDIETPSRSGIDIARIIRIKDVNSIIIFLTGHEELGMTILKDEIMCLSFINKFDESEIRLERCFNKAFKIMNIKNRLSFTEKSVAYNIPFEDIIYITRDSIERKCIIKTSYSEIKTYRSLDSILRLLDKRFIQTHRACIINQDRVVNKNIRKKYILFDNGVSINLVSKKYFKESKKV